MSLKSVKKFHPIQPFIFVTVLLAASIAQAQSIGVGASFVRSSAYDPSPLTTRDGGANHAAIHVEAIAPLPLNLEVRLLGSYGFRPELPTIHTRDEGSKRKAKADVRLRPSVRLYLTPAKRAFVRPFAEGGIEYFRQRFDRVESEPEPIPGPVPAYDEGHERPLPASGLNPLLTFGVSLGEYNEASFTRIFPDNTILNASELQGYRIAYSYTKELSKRLSFKITAEADYLRYREAAGFDPGDADNYYEKDFVYRVRATLILGGAK